MKLHIRRSAGATLMITALTILAVFMITAGAWTQNAQAATNTNTNTMTIYAIDMGKGNAGEATMVVGGNGGSLLIDAGDNDTDNIFRWLNDNGYKKKRFNLLITHWHEDHVNNVVKLLRDYSVGTLFIPKADYLSGYSEIVLYQNVTAAAKKYKTKIVYLYKGQTIGVGNSVKGKVLYVNGSPRSENDRKGQMINNQSAAILFTGGGSRFLAAGDVQKEAEQRILKSGVNIKADIYKMSHHGYPGSNIREFMKKVEPSYAWFTSYDATPSYYNPPSVQDAVRRISSTSNVFSTRYNGTICFTCSGGKISVKAQRNTNTMYRKLRHVKTGKETIVKYTFNKLGVPRLTAKILNPSVYTSTQVRSDGSMFTGNWKEENGHLRLKDSSGMYAVGTWAKCGGKYCLIDNNGTAKTGWREMDGKKIYLNPCLATGFTEINGKTYYLIDKNYKKFQAGLNGNEGRKLTGFVTIKGRRYYLIDQRCKSYKKYLAGVMATGWNTIAGNTYYMNSRGVIQKGFQKIGKYTYYFNNLGIMLRGLQTINGAKYYFEEYGQMHKGWLEIDGKRHYFGANGKMYVDTVAQIGQFRYHFDKNGAVIPKAAKASDSDGVKKTARGAVIGDDGALLGADPSVSDPANGANPVNGADSAFSDPGNGADPANDADSAVGDEADTGIGQGTDAGQDADTEQGTDAGQNAGDGHTGQGTDTGQDAGTGHTGQDTDTDQDAGTGHTGQGTDTGQDVGTEQGADAGQETDLGQEADPEQGTDIDQEVEADSEQKTDNGQEPDIKSEADIELEIDSE